MRNIDTLTIYEAVKNTFMDINYNTNLPLYNAVKNAINNETDDLPKNILSQIKENQEIAKAEQIPICQDTGMAILFVEIGDEIIISGNITDAITKGVKDAYIEGYLRKSVVLDPLFNRENTKDNTPPIIYYDIIKGNKINITCMAKGFGSENMSRTKMLKPADGVKGVKDFVVETVKIAGPNPCPPLIVGVGIGGTVEKSALLSKKALSRDIGINNPDINYKNLEIDLLNEINKLDIGPGGLGGKTTALAVNIEYFPTHIAGLPVTVNICCHASRHKKIIL